MKNSESINLFLKEFEFRELVDVDNPSKPLLFDQENVIKELLPLKVDKVHFSGKFPAVLFKEVTSFSDKYILKEIAEIHHKVWNYRKVCFLYVTSPIEIRIYNCSHNPFNYKNPDINIEDELKKLELSSCLESDKIKIKKLKNIFSAIAIDSGLIWIKDNSYIKKINIKQRIDRFLINSLLKTGELLKNRGLAVEVVHSLIMRSLFIMYLEDRGATPESFYSKEKEKATSYLDLLNDINATYEFYKKIEMHFNGNVFPVTKGEMNQVKPEHLIIIKRCLTDGYIDFNQPQFFNWRIFNFNIIPVELLSEIYENFLNEFDKDKKKESGSFYTHPVLVDLMLNNALPISKGENNFKLKILDPACGSGIFLVEAYKRIVNRWQNANLGKKITFKKLSKLLLDYIFGVEIDPKAIKVTAFSLYLAVLDFLEPRDLWYRDGNQFPYLINDPEDNELHKQGHNLYRTNTIQKKGDFEQDYDLIIGNPPFGTKYLKDYIKEYCKDLGFSKQFVIPFIHKSTTMCPKGIIALLFNSKLLTNTEKPAQIFRKWLFQDTYVEKIYNLSILRNAPKNFGGKLFDSAQVPVSIVIFRKQYPNNPSPLIEYWAPKTYVRNHVIEGIVIDKTDIKYLP